ncbi:MAG: DUF2277 domain-containing protein [Myxococcaceae bacterium]|nr:DUF2277 domain-containing protein [Myxococcaceae bacterium]
MCRNIRVLHNFEPPATNEEVHAAALQFVRKVSGLSKPNEHDFELLEKAAALITKETKRLLRQLPKRGQPRTRDGEIAKARAKWVKREEQMFNRFKQLQAQRS